MINLFMEMKPFQHKVIFGAKGNGDELREIHLNLEWQ